MATTVARLQAVLGAETRDFDRAMGRSESKLKSVGKTAAFAAGAAALGAITYTLKTGVKEWMEQQKVAAQTNAVLKSTGGIAGVSAKHVSSLATSLMKKSGVDDEAIQSGENLLLTFKNIRNEAGRGNDIFDQATTLTLDLSRAFGKDLNSSAILVGKALQDPVKGMTALRRVGVTLSESQQDLVKRLVKSGDTMKAQKIILGELKSEVGGSAEAYGKTLPGMISIARESFNNWAGDLVAKMIPVLTDLGNWFRVHWPEISASIKRFWVNTKPVLTATLDLFKAIYQFVRDHWSTIGPIVRQAFTSLGAAAKILTGILQVMADLLRGDWSAAWNHFKGVLTAFKTFLVSELKVALLELKAVFGVLKAVGKEVWGEITRAAQSVLRPFTAAIGAIQKAVAGLRGEFHTLWSIFSKVIDGFKWLIDHIKSIIGFFGKVGGAVGDAGNNMKQTGDGIGEIRRGAPPPGGGGGVGRQFNIGRQLWDEIAMGQKLGLRVTSGYRPGAVTKHGTPSDHGHNPSRAVDMAGSTNAMAAMFNWLVGRKEIRQAFFDPMGSIFNGVRSSYREGGHSDHIHIAEYDKGGFLRPGWNLAYNGLGRPEPVGGTLPSLIQLVLPDGRLLAQASFSGMQSEAAIYRARTGRNPF